MLFVDLGSLFNIIETKMNKPRYFQEDTYHHLYNRGANKAKIFFNDADYKIFGKRLHKYKKKYLVEVLCYCLMPNHFHIFARQTLEEYPLSKFISALTNSYTKSINKKYSRTGVLFQGRTKNKIIHDETAFSHLVRYILLNPVKAKLCKKFEDYEYSSAKELLGLKDMSITDKTILSYFSDGEDLKRFITGSDMDEIITGLDFLA
jgi:putative transposase